MMLYDKPNLAVAAALFSQACSLSRSYDAVLANYCLQFGDHGPVVSGAGRDHFPDDAKTHLRRLCRSVTHYSDKAWSARPRGVHDSTMRKLSQQIAKRDGCGFYGPFSA